MTEQRREEKEEEKEEEKQQEKDEKGRGGDWRRDPLSTFVWAAVLIWAGLVLLGDNLGLLTRFEGLQAWSIIALGAGVILLAEVVIRLLVPSYRRPVLGTIILAAVLLAVGLGSYISWNVIWPIALIVIGLIVLLGALLRRR
jgi:hypothetical protein